jgi:hypothetical protein
MCVSVLNTSGMDDHIKPLRLFDLSQSETRRKPIELEPWEKEHLRQCKECQRVLEVFSRQFSPGRPAADKDSA